MLNSRYRRGLRAVAALAAAIASILGIVAWSNAGNAPLLWRFRVSSGDYTTRADRSIRLLEHTFYNGTGLWHMCRPRPLGCFTKNRDWGSDALTYVLYLRW